MDDAREDIAVGDLGGAQEIMRASARPRPLRYHYTPVSPSLAASPMGTEGSNASPGTELNGLLHYGHTHPLDGQHGLGLDTTEKHNG